MPLLLKVIKGALIGIAVVIPGVSGGSMAMSMGIYGEVIDFFTFRNGFLKRGRRLLPYGVGVLLGTVVFSYLIELLFESYPFPTACAFMGMILGALPMLYKRVRGRPVRLPNILLLLCAAAAMVAMTVFSGEAGAERTFAPTAAHVPVALGIGFAAAATMTVPGLSGSMTLILLGYFRQLLSVVNGLTAALIRLDFSAMGRHAVLLVPFCVGAVLGIMFMARVVRALLRRYPLATYSVIIGLVLVTPFTVLYQQQLANVGAASWIAGALLLAGGFLLTVLLGGEEDAVL